MHNYKIEGGRPPHKLISRRNLLRGGTAVALAGLAGPVYAARKRKTNFIVIMVDDLGYGDIGPYGNKVIPTPNLDRMAADGMVLTQYYSPAAVCTPSRAGMLTGRFPVRSGMSAVIMPAHDTGLPLNEYTTAKLLKPDYATALFGKWHLGHKGPAWPPTNHGFDEYFGIPYSHDMNPLALYEAYAGKDEIKSYPVDFEYKGAGLFDPAKDVPKDLVSSLQQQFYGATERFIEKNKDNPFYVELWLSAPHLPEIPDASFVGTSDAGRYGDMIVEIDSIVGRLRDKLKHLKIEQDTMILFTSDNGPWYWGSAGDLRDRKGSGRYDGGSKVPFLAVQSGVIPSGQRVEWMASGTDILPTLCSIAGRPLPPSVELDGVNISSILLRGEASSREYLPMFQGEDIIAIRDQRWKYARGREYSLFGYDELYDLDKDPKESYNVRDRNPEIIEKFRKIFDEKVKFYSKFKSKK